MLSPRTTIVEFVSEVVDPLLPSGPHTNTTTTMTSTAIARTPYCARMEEKRCQPGESVSGGPRVPLPFWTGCW